MFHVKHFNDSVPLIRAHLLRADTMPPRIRLRVFPYAAHTIEDGFMQASVYFRVDTSRAEIPCAQVQLPNIGIMFFSIRREFFIIHSFTPPLQYVPLAYFHLYDRLTRKMHISPRSFGIPQRFTFQGTRRACADVRGNRLFTTAPRRAGLNCFCGVHPHYNARRPEKSSIFAKFFMFYTLHKNVFTFCAI